MRHQRCMWHGKHDFLHPIHEGLKKPDQRPFIDQLHAIAAMSMTKAKLEKLKPRTAPTCGSWPNNPAGL